MHKATTVMALVALLTVVVAGVAYAATIEGNANDNYLEETCKGDTMYGRGGNDVLKGGSGNDRITDKKGKDKLLGQGGRDTLNAKDGNRGDLLKGGGGKDRVIKDRQDKARSI